MLLCIWSTLFFSACSEQGRQQTDTLNELSYAYHYRNLDSTELYARKALSAATHYDAGKAEAFNNLAFVNIARNQGHAELERRCRDLHIQWRTGVSFAHRPTDDPPSLHGYVLVVLKDAMAETGNDGIIPRFKVQPPRIFIGQHFYPLAKLADRHR